MSQSRPIQSLKPTRQRIARGLFVAIHCVPAGIGVGLYEANPLWLATSLLLGLALLATLDATAGAIGRSFVGLLSGALLTAGMLLGASFYLQGEAFNARFFFHADTSSLAIALSEYPGFLWTSVSVIALGLAMPAGLRRSDRRTPPIALALVWLLVLAIHYPSYSLLKYIAEDDGFTPAPVAPPPIATPAPVAPATPAATEPPPVAKNIVLIYAESLERTYLDRAAFGTLLPQISELARGALDFTNLVQVRGTGWTMSGIVASQCGFPLLQSNELAANSSMASAEGPFADQRCLADILAAHGYRNVFLGGAPLWFAGKGKFLKTHGYDEVYGRDQLTALLDDPEYLSGWGLFDDSLLQIALDKLTELEGGDAPYLLTVLTVDTHHPNGNPSRSCRALADNRDRISNAIYCSDQLIGAFIREVTSKVDPAKTVVVLFSDHLAMRNTLFAKLRAMTASRRLMLMIFGDGFAGTNETRGNHFDIPPTLLAVAGIEGYPTLNSGRNLLDPVVAGARRDSAATPRLFPPGNNLRAGALLSDDELSIRVGDLTVRANADGDEFSAGLYVAVFGEDGDLVDTVYARDFGALLSGLTNRFVIGFSKFAETPDEVSYFYGRLTERGEHFVVKPLQGKVRLRAADFAAAYEWAEGP